MFSVFISFSAISVTAGFRHFNCTKDGEDVLIHPFYLCNNHKICDDGSDESECGSCHANFGFVCDDGRSCIQKQLVCDGNPDCADKSDEDFELCRPACSDSERKCFLPREGWFGCAKQCDGKAECFDALDERFCRYHGNVTNQTCVTICENKNVCVLEDQRCDSVNDCGDFADELFCPGNSDSTHKCQNGVMIDSTRICDGYSDCGDHSDEKDCGNVATATKKWFCAVSFFRPANNSLLGAVPFHQEIPRQLLCNKVPDCENGHDEIGCRSDNPVIPTTLLIILLFSLVCVLIVSCALYRERKKGALEISATKIVDRLYKGPHAKSGKYEIVDC